MLSQLHAVDIPWVPLFILLSVLVVVGGAFGLNFLYKGMRDLRQNFAEEVKRELSAAREAKQIAVQQPLEVREHKEYVTRTEFTERHAKLDTELARHAARRAEIYEEQKGMAVRLGALEKETANQTAALAELKQDGREMRARIDDLPRRTAEAINAFAPKS